MTLLLHYCNGPIGCHCDCEYLRENWLIYEGSSMQMTKSSIHFNYSLGLLFIQRLCFTSIRIHIIKIRWSHDCLSFIMGIPIPGKTLYWNRTLVYYHISQVQFPYSDWSVYDVTLLILVPSQLCCPPRRPVCIHSLIVGDSPPSLIGDRVAELRDHSGYGLSQWVQALLCNAFSHWSSPYPEWSLELNSGGS